MSKLQSSQITLIQKALSRVGLWRGELTGIATPELYQAIYEHAHLGNEVALSWPNDRQAVLYLQQVLRLQGLYSGKLDGYAGPLTDLGSEQLIERWDLAYSAPEPIPLRSQEAEPEQDQRPGAPPYRLLTEQFGPPGQVPLATVTPPYRLVWDWDLNKQVTKFAVHRDLAETVERCLEQVMEKYDESQRTTLGLHRFGGCYNPRKMRGGTRWSTHAWGVAMDWYPSQNKLRWGAGRALFAGPEYAQWFDIWGQAGFRSLGILRNYDWMHIQYCQVHEKTGAPFGSPNMAEIAHWGPGYRVLTG